MFDRFIGRVTVAAAHSGFHGREWREDEEREEREERGGRKIRLRWEMPIMSSIVLSVSFSLNVCMAGDERACWTGRKGQLLMERQQKRPSVLLSPPPCILFPFLSIHLIVSLSLCLCLDIYPSLCYSLPFSSAFFLFLLLSPPPPAPSSLLLFSFILSGRAGWNRICRCVFGDR